MATDSARVDMSFLDALVSDLPANIFEEALNQLPQTYIDHTIYQSSPEDETLDYSTPAATTASDFSPYINDNLDFDLDLVEPPLFPIDIPTTVVEDAWAQALTAITEAPASSFPPALTVSLSDLALKTTAPDMSWPPAMWDGHAPPTALSPSPVSTIADHTHTSLSSTSPTTSATRRRARSFTPRQCSSFPASCNNASLFSRKCDLDKHEKLHLRVFPCTRCVSRFATRKDLARHEAIHGKTEEKTYIECKVAGCGKRFGRVDNMVAHVRKFHGGEGL